jgi:hypothetical protein
VFDKGHTWFDATPGSNTTHRSSRVHSPESFADMIYSLSQTASRGVAKPQTILTIVSSSPRHDLGEQNSPNIYLDGQLRRALRSY